MQFTKIIINELFYSDHLEFSKTYAMVVMPDHLHWLFQLNRKLDLSQLIGRIKANTSRNIHKFSPEADRIWQTNFHDRAIRSEERVEAAIKYVINNPVRAGLVKSIYDYPYWYALNTKGSPL